MRAVSDLVYALLPFQRYRPLTVYSPDPELRARASSLASLTERHDVPLPLFTSAQRNLAAFTYPAPAVRFESRVLTEPGAPQSFYTVAFSPSHEAFVARLRGEGAGAGAGADAGAPGAASPARVTDAAAEVSSQPDSASHADHPNRATHADPRTLHVVVIFPPMGSGPYTRCIRRLVSRLCEAGPSGDEFICCVQIPRQSKDSELPLECSKHRNSFLNNEDTVLLAEHLDGLLEGHAEGRRVLLHIVGYSLGSMMLVRLLRNEALLRRLRALRNIQLGACCALYTNFDPHVHQKQTNAQQRSFGTFYVNILRKNRSYYEKYVPASEIDAAIADGRLWVLDKKITSKMNDCASLEEYYGEMMPPGHLGEIDESVPLLFLCVQDDVAVGPVIETEEFARQGKRRVCVVQLNKGGHLGTVTRDGKDLCGQIVKEWIGLF